MTGNVVSPLCAASSLPDADATSHAVPSRFVVANTNADVVVAGVAAIARLHPFAAPPTPEFDRSELLRLLAMAGPETARDLLDRLISDLTGVQRGLNPPGPEPDWDAICNHSHVLISRAGALGGRQFQTEAGIMYQIGRRQDRQAFFVLLPDVLQNLSAMIMAVQRVRQIHLVQTE